MSEQTRPPITHWYHTSRRVIFSTTILSFWLYFMFPPNALATADRSWLFGVDSGASDASSTLVRIDIATNFVEVIGETNAAQVTDIAFLPDGKLFGVQSSQLLRIDPQTGAASAIGTGLGTFGINGLVSNAHGQLYAASVSGQFFRIDPQSGLATKIGDFGTPLVSGGDLAFSKNGTLFGAAKGSLGIDLLVKINIATAKAQVIGQIGFPDVFGLAFGPDDELYGISKGRGFSIPDLIRIDQSTGAGTLLGPVQGVEGMFGLAANAKLSPVTGIFRVTGTENPQCNNDPNPNNWTFCQHQTGFHGGGGGVQGSDDTYAWDVNLLNNADKGKPVFAMAPGKVVDYAGQIPPTEMTNTSGAVLVEHSPFGTDCTVTPQDCWWSGYLHMENINVSTGDIVDITTKLGSISNVFGSGNIPDHLHLVIYDGVNDIGQLASMDATFMPSPIDFSRNDLLIDFGSGIGLWARINNTHWKNLAGVVPNDVVIADLDSNGLDDLIVDFGQNLGLLAYMNNVNWTQLHTASSQGQMVVGDVDGDGGDDIVAELGGAFGLQVYLNNSTWRPIASFLSSRILVADVDGNSEDDAVVDFGSSLGLWAYMNNTNWARLTVHAPAGQIAVGDFNGNGIDDLVIEFGGILGLWVRLDNSSWKKINGILSQQIFVSDIDANGEDDIVADFGIILGIWAYMNNSAWTRLTAVSPIGQMIAGDVDGNGVEDLVIDFGPIVGIWVRFYSTVWKKINSNSSEMMTVADIDSNGQKDIIFDFGSSLGLWVYMNGATWKKLTNLSPATQLAVGNIDGS